MKKEFCLLILLGYSAICFSQQRQLDSLNGVIRRGQPDTAVANAYIALAEILYTSQPDTLIPLANKALEIVNKKMSVAGAAEKHCLLKVKANATNNIGYAYEQLGYIGKALDYYDKSCKLFEELGDKQGIAATLNNIGYIYQNQGSPDKALEYHHKCYDLLAEIGDKESMARSLINTGLIYQAGENYPKALDYFQRATKIAEELHNDAVLNAAINNIGYLYELKNDFNGALHNYQQTLSSYEALNDIQGRIYALTHIARLYGKMKQWDLAEKYVRPLMALSLELKYPANIRNASELAADIAEHQGKPGEALKMYKLYTQMRDSVFNQETRKASLKKQFQYDYEKKTAADSIRNIGVQKVKDAEIETQKLQLKQERTQRISLYGGLALVLLFSGLIYNRFRISQKQRLIIEQQKRTVEEKNREIIDSINYAKRIQKAHMPTEAAIQKNLTRLKK
ncbi:MAG: tetratricopeptide repeat protein [Bacteroidia bacterium]